MKRTRKRGARWTQRLPGYAEKEIACSRPFRAGEAGRRLFNRPWRSARDRSPENGPRSGLHRCCIVPKSMVARQVRRAQRAAHLTRFTQKRNQECASSFVHVFRVPNRREIGLDVDNGISAVILGGGALRMNYSTSEARSEASSPRQPLTSRLTHACKFLNCLNAATLTHLHCWRLQHRKAVRRVDEGAADVPIFLTDEKGGPLSPWHDIPLQ